jgi:hypothetical protein
MSLLQLAGGPAGTPVVPLIELGCSHGLDAGVANSDVQARRVVVRASFGDLPEGVGSHCDHVLTAPVPDVPQRRDLDLLAWRHRRGMDGPQFPVDVGAVHPEPRGGLLRECVPTIVDGGRQLGYVGSDATVLIREPIRRVADSDQADDQVRNPGLNHSVLTASANGRILCGGFPT